MKKIAQSGFTLVEMLVVAPIIILVIGATVFAIVQLTGLALAERSTAAMVNDIHSTLDKIEDDIRSSAAFLGRNSVTIASPQGLDNGTGVFDSVSASDGDRLILNTYVTTANPQLATRNLVYLPNQPNSCGSSSVNQNTIATMNVVYFIKDSTLWRRTLANSNYLSQACSGFTPWQQPSCALGITGTMCVTQDERLVSGVQPDGFVVQYYTAASDTTENVYTQSTDLTTRQNALDTTPTARITLRSNQVLNGQDVIKQGTLTVTRAGSVVR